MEKLNFDNDRNGNDFATYRGLRIEVMRDDNAENPFTMWDSEPPIAVSYRGELTEYGDCRILHPLDNVKGSWISFHWRKLAAILCVEQSLADSDAREKLKEFGHSIATARLEVFEESLAELKPSQYGGNVTDYFAAIAAIWKLRGVVALDSCTTGYSQGDYADVLAVAHPDWTAQAGAPLKSHAKQLEYAVKLYGFWAWGDCYGFQIISGGDNMDSCYGFYGTDYQESGLAEAAKEAADGVADEIERAASEREAERDLFGKYIGVVS